MERVAYSRRARLRLALSQEYAELSDACRDRVATDADEYARRGERLDEALRAQFAAQRIVQLAVAYERKSGTSWQEIADVVNITRQAAHERYAAAVDELDKDIAAAWALDDPQYPGLADGARDPAETVDRLDRWVARHVLPGDWLAQYDVDDPRRQHAVSSDLPAPSMVDMTNLILTVANLLAADDPRASQQLRRGLAHRKVELYETLVAEETAEPGRTRVTIDDLRDQLAAARARLAELDPTPGENG